MADDIAIKVESVSKCYQIYDQPSDRLKQFLFRNRRQYYREFWALKNVSFEVKKGDAIGIVGRNGSGKSTLLRTICGTLNSTGGFVETKGRVAALLELGSGFNPEFTGVENVYLYASLLGLSRQEVDQKFEQIRKFADIGDFINQPLKSYSSGMVVRLAFAVIVHVDADILVIDEALAVGDIFFSSKCIQFLKEFAIRGTVLFVSHDVNSVLNLCNKAILIKDGTLELIGSPKDAVDAYHAENIKSQETATAKNGNSSLDKKAVQTKDLNNPNEINRLSGFRAEAKSSGVGGAQIVSACFKSDDVIVRTLLANSDVEFHVWAEVSANVTAPILGFSVKNKQGLLMYELNTSETSSFDNDTSSRVYHSFIKFRVPPLRTGQYLVDVAIANGSLFQHTQLQWLYDAMSFNILNDHKSNGVLSFNPLSVGLEAISK